MNEEKKIVCQCEDCGEDILEEDTIGRFNVRHDYDYTEYKCFNCGAIGVVE